MSNVLDKIQAATKKPEVNPEIAEGHAAIHKMVEALDAPAYKGLENQPRRHGHALYDKVVGALMAKDTRITHVRIDRERSNPQICNLTIEAQATAEGMDFWLTQQPGSSALKEENAALRAEVTRLQMAADACQAKYDKLKVEFDGGVFTPARPYPNTDKGFKDLFRDVFDSVSHHAIQILRTNSTRKLSDNLDDIRRYIIQCAEVYGGIVADCIVMVDPNQYSILTVHLSLKAPDTSGVVHHTNYKIKLPMDICIEPGICTTAAAGITIKKEPQMYTTGKFTGAGTFEGIVKSACLPEFLAKIKLLFEQTRASAIYKDLVFNDSKYYDPFASAPSVDEPLLEKGITYGPHDAVLSHKASGWEDELNREFQAIKNAHEQTPKIPDNYLDLDLEATPLQVEAAGPSPAVVLGIEKRPCYICADPTNLRKSSDHQDPGVPACPKCLRSHFNLDPSRPITR